MRYWRTKQGQKVDFVLGIQNAVPVEVKRTCSHPQRDVQGLRAFMVRYPTPHAYVVSRYTNKASELPQGTITYLPGINFAGRILHEA